MEISPIKKLSYIEEPADLAKYKFSDYSRDNYRDGSPYAHTRGRLFTPLHDLNKNEENSEAALTIFHVIQRFMLDLPEAKQGYMTEEDNVFMRTMERNAEYRKNTGTFKRKIDSVKLPEWKSLPPLSSMSKPSSNIAKVRFICSYGIFRPDLRDEIYNQLCVQLTDNPSSTSTSRGWILMALCLGCFPPSDKFLNFLRNFLKQGPEGYGEYCQKRLRRTLEVGNRKLSPSLIEMHAAKVEGKIMLPVTTMDGKTEKYEVDSSTTCEELLHQLVEKLGIKSLFGFSVFAKVFNEVFNWGCGEESVMDIISLCEQYGIHKHLPESENSSNWSIFVRKDIFLSSHKPSMDPVENNLVYSQIVGGIAIGEYVCDSNEELADFLSMRYYIEHGKDFDNTLAGKMLEQSVPESFLETHEEMELVNLIRDTFNASTTIRTAASPDVVKQEVVALGKSKWSREFSRMYNAILVSGPKIPKGQVKVFMYSKGINFLSFKKDKGAFFLSLDFDHVANITNDSPKHVKNADTISFVSFQKYDKTNYILKSNGALEMKKIGNILLDDYRKGEPLYQITG